MIYATNNKFIVRKLTKRTMKANKIRNIFVVIAIALTAFLITTIFSIGMSIIESYQLQQLRTMGTAAHAALTYPTGQQIQKLKELDYIEEVGIQSGAGTIENSRNMGNMSLGLHWYDESEWEKLRKPAISDVVGTYPQKYNEIMVPTWILKKMGITKPDIGMEIEVKYHITKGRYASEPKMQKFILSAYYTEYMNLRSDNIGSMLVSKAFLDSTGLTPENAGAASIKLKSGSNVTDQLDRLEKIMNLSGDQKIKIVPIYDTSSNGNTSTMLGLAGVVLFIMLSGYLLIYNVLYISISKDIRFFGLLKTIGTTPKQIRKIVKDQALRLSYIGIPAGLILGAVTSLVAVPLALSGTSGIENGITVSFNPVIFLGAALFSLITTILSSIKPARKAGSISPIEAIRFTGATVKCSEKKGTNGGKLYKMAFRNIFRDRKRAVVVFSSLFLGITTFLTVNTLVLSMDTDNYIASYVDNDFTLTNNTDKFHSGGVKRKFDNGFMSDIKSLKGITDLKTVSKEEVIVKYDDELYKSHVTDFCKRFKIDMFTNKQFDNNPEFFWSNIVGLDTEYVREINKKLDKPIDIEAFENGKIALFSTNKPELYKVNSDITFNLRDQTQKITLKLGGFLPDRTSYKGGGGIAPNIFISNSKMKQLVKDPLIFAVTIDADSAYESKILSQLKQLIGGDNGISMDSRLEMLDQFSDSKNMLYILGGGMSLVLALIGILNFVNVMVTGVNVRRQEFAVIESIGMTKTQLKKMLIFEGLTYAVISCGLVMMLGNAITYGLFLLFKTEAEYAIFTFPAIPLAISIFIIFTVCAIVPTVAYKSASKQSITQRLRSSEG